MQWNNSEFQQQPNQDVYSDIKTSYFGGSVQDSADAQEFSLTSIQERLGEWNSVEVSEDVTSADLKPSEQTLKMSYQRKYDAQSVGEAIRTDTKTKVAIASYVIVVLALIIAVTLCSVYVAGVYGSAISLSSDYAHELANLEELELLRQTHEEDFASLAQRAAELGYIDAAQSTTMEYTEIETRPAQNYQVGSNWFDSLCDWLCGVFGG